MPRRPAKLPAGIRRRAGRQYEIHYVGPLGTRVQEIAGDDLRAAVRYREERIAAVKAGTWTPTVHRRTDRLRFDAWADTWIQKRRDRPNPPRTIDDDEARLREHVRPLLGRLPLVEISVDHVRELLSMLRSKSSSTTGKPLSPNTIHNVWGTFAKCLRDAAKEIGRQGVAWVPPVDLLDDGEAPERVSRPRGSFQRAELELLISDPRLQVDHRTFWALLGFTGMRHDEAAGLRWRDIDFRAEPLARITLVEQAGGRPLKEDRRGHGKRREIPVHRTLATILEAWRTGGFAALHGRHPRPDDYVVPSTLDVRRFRPVRSTLKQLERDCRELRIPARMTHELRNTFATLASTDAPELEQIVATITHSVKPVAGAFNTYRGSRWLAQCEAVLRLDVRLERHAKVVALPRAAVVAGPSDLDPIVDLEGPNAKTPVGDGGFGGADGTRTLTVVSTSEPSRVLTGPRPPKGDPRDSRPIRGRSADVDRSPLAALARELAEGGDEVVALRVLRGVARRLGISAEEMAKRLDGRTR